ncbi:MAG: hypothetical protein WBE22_08495 [Halobacteriota archaeon]
MKISSQLKGGIYDVSFRYNTNLGAYTTLMSDIPKLCEIAFKEKIGGNYHG